MTLLRKRPSKLTVVLSGVVIAILLGGGLFVKSIFLPEAPKIEAAKTEVLGQSFTPIPSPLDLPSPSPSLKPTFKPVVKASVKPSASPSPSTTTNPSSSPTQTPTASSTPNSATTSSPSPTPTPSATPSPSAVVSTVNLEIPGSSFQVEISGDMNVCQVMQKAKDQGKISSLTLDDSYMSTMNSLYVREMNGLSNNWTFKVNGNSPLGCSLYQVKPEDLIVWKFG